MKEQKPLEGSTLASLILGDLCDRMHDAKAMGTSPEDVPADITAATLVALLAVIGAGQGCDELHAAGLLRELASNLESQVQARRPPSP